MVEAMCEAIAAERERAAETTEESVTVEGEYPNEDGDPVEEEDED